mgnify:CR=1 FL=1
MNRFFVENEVYEDRIEICKGCAYYYKPTGSCKICMCFMKIKALIANQHCPQKYWDKTSEVMKAPDDLDRKSTRLNSSHGYISYAVFCLKKKIKNNKKYSNNH